MLSMPVESESQERRERSHLVLVGSDSPTTLARKFLASRGWGEGATRMAQKFTRRFTPNRSQPFTWLVLVGEECAEKEISLMVPDEAVVRRLLRIPWNVPILIGRP